MRRSDWTPHRAVDSETLCAEFGVLHVIIWSVPKEVDAFGTKGYVTEMKSEHEISSLPIGARGRVMLQQRVLKSVARGLMFVVGKSSPHFDLNFLISKMFKSYSILCFNTYHSC